MGKISSNATTVRVLAALPAGTPAWLSSISTLHTWKRLVGSSVGLWPALKNADGTVDRGLGAYSSAVYDPIRKQIVFNGGGHGDSYNNGVFAVKLGQDVPSAVVLKSGSTATPVDVSYNPVDGTPSARHTYWHIQYVPQLEMMFQFGGAAMAGTGNYNDRKVNAFNLKTNAWMGSSNSPFADRPTNTNPAEGVCLDGDGNAYVASPGNYSLYKWTRGTPGSWSQFEGIDFGGGGDTLLFDPSRNRILGLGGGKIFSWNINAPGSHTNLTVSGAGAAVANSGNSWIYTPDGQYPDHFIGIAWSTMNLYKWNLSTNVIESLPIGGTQPPVPLDYYGSPNGHGLGSYQGRFGIAPEYGVVFLAPEICSNDWKTPTDVYVFRYK